MSTLDTCFSSGLHGLTYKQTRIAEHTNNSFNISKSIFVQFFFCIYKICYGRNLQEDVLFVISQLY